MRRQPRKCAASLRSRVGIVLSMALRLHVSFPFPFPFLWIEKFANCYCNAILPSFRIALKCSCLVQYNTARNQPIVPPKLCILDGDNSPCIYGWLCPTQNEVVNDVQSSTVQYSVPSRTDLLFYLSTVAAIMNLHVSHIRAGRGSVQDEWHGMAWHDERIRAP